MLSFVESESEAIAQELELAVESVSAALRLLDEGNTVAFIARFRRDQTLGLDEERILEVRQWSSRYRALEDRRGKILKTLRVQKRLTSALQQRIEQATTLSQLEEIYLPFKPKRQSRATVARERGLEPLAGMARSGTFTATEFQEAIEEFAIQYEPPLTVVEVRQGIGHLLAESFSEESCLRDEVRGALWRDGRLRTTVWEDEGGRESVIESGGSDVTQAAVKGPAVKGPAGDSLAGEGHIRESRGVAESAAQRKRRKEKGQFSDYFDFVESLASLPPHRVLAINRGERAKAIRAKLQFDSDAVFARLSELAIPTGHPLESWLSQALRDALSRLLLPSLEREVRRELTERAERHAVNVFARNLRHLLLQPPVRGRSVLAIDPGYKSGCQVAVLDCHGAVLDHGLIYVVGHESRRNEGQAWLAETIRRHGVSVVAVGNGAASREAEELVARVFESDFASGEIAGQRLVYAIVNEAGASIYSTSEAGREELPALDPTIRSAVSIGRRLLDPISELVKISPENLGVGMYQHDVKARHLRDTLDEVVASCVNYVGVDVNTASPALLKYVSGLNQLSARRLVEYRNEHGPFRSRAEFRQVPGFGEATFTQAAGFLRIDTPDHPLDATWIHPESYELAERILEQLGLTLSQIFAVEPTGGGDSEGVGTSESGVVADGLEESSFSGALERLESADPEELAGRLETSPWLVRDLLDKLRQPGRDPRETLPPPLFRTGITRLEDLQPHMSLSARILNVVDFGVFVDIGLSESALVHISRLSRDFVQDPHEHFAVGQMLTVWVVEVDRGRRRVSLTAVDPSETSRGRNEKVTTRGRKRIRSDGSGGVGKRHRPRSRVADRKVSRPVVPLSPDMVEGKTPMRSFGELLQFYEENQGPDGSTDR